MGSNDKKKEIIILTSDKGIEGSCVLSECHVNSKEFRKALEVMFTPHIGEEIYAIQMTNHGLRAYFRPIEKT